MKTTTFCIACSMIAGLSFAQSGEKRPDGGNRMAEFLQRIDANKDGKVSKEEFLEFSKKEGEDRFGKIDANADGVADEAEMKTAMEKMRGGGQGKGGRPEGGEGGGFRRPPEGQGKPEGGPPGDRPKGDPERRPEGGPPGQGRPEGGAPGAGGPGGMRGMMGAMGNPEEAFKKMDKNADGSVDLNEYKELTNAETEGRFKNMDSNGDGKVTSDEFKAVMERMRGMMRGGQGGPGGSGGMRRPGGEGGGGEGGGFRRPPSQEGGARPRPEGEGDKPEAKKPEGV